MGGRWALDVVVGSLPTVVLDLSLPAFKLYSPMRPNKPPGGGGARRPVSNWMADTLAGGSKLNI